MYPKWRSLPQPAYVTHNNRITSRWKSQQVGTILACIHFNHLVKIACRGLAIKEVEPDPWQSLVNEVGYVGYKWLDTTKLIAYLNIDIYFVIIGL